MKIFSFVLIVFFYLIFLNLNLHAQITNLEKGDTIKVSLHTLYSFNCTFQKFENDSLFIMKEKLFSFPLRNIKKVEQFEGKKSNTYTGAVAGSVLGGLVLGISMYTSENNSEGYSSVGQPGFWNGFAAGTVLGGGVGALIGSGILSDKWRQVYPEEK